MKIDISKADKAEVLAALYNSSKPLGMGILQFQAQDMTKEEADKILGDLAAETPDWPVYFDYLQGRVIKVHLDSDILEPWLYDRDNGQGAALQALVSREIPCEEIPDE